MKNTYYILQRELYAYFASPIAYVIMGFFLAFSGVLFSGYLSPTSDANTVMRQWFSVSGFVMLFIGALLPTRLIAEEQRTGTLELLFTSPVRDWEVVLGKFLATVALFLLLVVLTFYYLVALIVLGGQFDWGPILTGYVGLILLCSVFFAIGLMASAFTQSQAVAAVISIILSLFLWIAGPLFVRQSEDNWWANTLNFLSLQPHIDSFSKGVFDLRDIVFYLSIITLFLVITTQVLKVRRAD
ncbi:MAG: ABC transporter permease subunit [Chloroflexota bacterium]|nr:ABC transporter permease subunit [Chloroflexota bacterium]